jgi:hypothetical protein
VLHDGRALRQSLFFVDKDHTDIMGLAPSAEPQVFQTSHYSIENYLVSEETFSGYWSEILHLDTHDERKAAHWARFQNAYEEFVPRLCTLMALVLIGRGIDERPPRKLNLNNARLELVFDLNFESGRCAYRPGAGQHFVVATNAVEYPSQQVTALKSIILRHLGHRPPKTFIRGKYELWFFVKFLQATAQMLSSRRLAKESGLRRATPKVALTQEAAVELLAGRASCPADLQQFLSGVQARLARQ